jgi:hypothetical protein
MFLAGLVGPSTSLKAIHAALACKGNVTIYPDVPEGPNDYSLLYDSAGYERYIGRIANGIWHMMLVSRVEGFMPVLNRAALWRKLNSVQFTTPLLKAWLPWIHEEMVRRELLIPLRCFNCQCGWLKATDTDLDAVVSDGLRGGQLTIE